MTRDFEHNTWDIINNYFKNTSNYLTKHHLDSFNDFIEDKIPQTFKQYNPQIIYKEYNTETDNYKYETHIYYGGKDSTSIYIAKPVIYKEDDIGRETKTQLYPNEARLRNLTYSSFLFCDILVEYHIINDGDSEPTIISKTFDKINIGRIPIMLQSNLCIVSDATMEMKKQMGECPYDQGGYFVVEGQEKVIVSHERKAENKLYIVASGDSLYSYSAQIKSIPEDSFKYARTTVVNINSQNDTITVRLPMIHKQIPLFILFKLLGVESDKEILEYILLNLSTKKAELFMEELRPSIEDAMLINDKEMAIKFLSVLTHGKTVSHLLDNIATDLFPHLGNNYKTKAYYLGYVVTKLLEVKLGIREPTDRDSFMFKRVDLSGFLLASLFRENYKQLQRDVKIAIDSEYRFNGNEYQNDNYSKIINSNNLKTIFNSKVMTDSFMRAFKIGTILNKKGLIQLLNRLSSVGTISHLRRINTLGDMIMMGQRKLHGTQYGIICPAETPDGGNIGIKKHMSVLSHITFGCSSKPIIEMLYEHGVLPLDDLFPEHIYNKVKVFVNGKWIGIHEEPLQLYNTLKTLRRNGLINVFTSIAFNYSDMELTLLTDGGRCTRPLYIVDNDKLLVSDKHFKGARDNTYTWNEFLGGFKENNRKLDIYNCSYNNPYTVGYDKKNIEADLHSNRGIIEFIDTDETNGSYIANDLIGLNSDTGYTHMEIHPSIIMGFLGYNIPYSNCSQAPRNVYGTGQSKQSVGMYVSNFRNRFDISAHVLSYPQRPLINTRLGQFSMNTTLPTGMNAIVAIGSYTGYNQEDSIIINKTAVERGLFRSFYFKTYETTERYDSKDNIEDIIGNPTLVSEVDIRREYNYSKLNEQGLVNEGDYVQGNDVLIGKYTKNGDNYIDNSEAVKSDGDGVVDKVFIDYMNTHNHRICKVRLCTLREPALGDKFASRHGQKGVLGMVLRQEDMPFTKDGITPDLIINPHAIPSRMTLGQFIECIQGKVCCTMGFFADATPFTNINSEDVSDILENKCGFMRHGDEVLYGGILGKQLETKLFIGPTYYQRLKHMVKDKINARSTGKYTLKNRQPPSGRAVGGGLRIGEMERDAILAHGTSAFLKESLIDRSDSYDYHISDMSGMVAIGNNSTNRFICPSNDGPVNFTNEEFMEDVKLDMPNSEQANVVPIRVPYSTKMLTQECESMGISMRLVPRDNADIVPIKVEPTEFKPQIKKTSEPNKRKMDVDSVKLPKGKQEKTRLSFSRFKESMNVPLTGFAVKNFMKMCEGSVWESLMDIYDKYNNSKFYLIKEDENKYYIIETIIDSVQYRNAISWFAITDINKEKIGIVIDISHIFQNESEPIGYSGYALDYIPKSPDMPPNSSGYVVPNSPIYNPTSPSYVPNSPAYHPTSPSYVPNSPVYHPTSPGPPLGEVLDAKMKKTQESYSVSSPSYAVNSPNFHPWDTFDPSMWPEPETKPLFPMPEPKPDTKLFEEDKLILAPVPSKKKLKKKAIIEKYGSTSIIPETGETLHNESVFPEDLGLQEVNIKDIEKQ